MPNNFIFRYGQFALPASLLVWAQNPAMAYTFAAVWNVLYVVTLL